MQMVSIDKHITIRRVTIFSYVTSPLTFPSSAEMNTKIHHSIQPISHNKTECLAQED
jgi:hypothetical protein